MLKVEHQQSYAILPAFVLIDRENVVCGMFLQQLSLHAGVSLQVVEAAHVDLVGYRIIMLPVEIDAVAPPHLARMQIMQAGGIVVAIGAR